MSTAQIDPNLTQVGKWRIFVQEDGISPASGYFYHGQTSIGGVAEALGDDTPVYLPSSERSNQWDIVDIVPSQRSLPTSDFTTRMNKLLTDVWWQLKRSGCRVNIQLVLDECGRPDDFSSWTSKILLSQARITDFNLPAFNVLSGDENTMSDITGSLTAMALEPIRGIRFEEQADAEVVAEVLDGVYYDVAQCGDCGVPSDGCSKVYFLTLANGGSPGLSSQIIVTTDRGNTWNSIDIPTLGGASGTRVAGVGRYLVVISEATASHHISLISDVDAGVTAWTEVDTGYTAGPRAIYVKSSRESFIAAASGVVYKLSDPTSGVVTVSDGSATTQDLNDIDGNANVVVAVGDNGAVLVSENTGDTFSARDIRLKDGTLITDNVTTVAVLSPRMWFIGAAGNLYYTIDGGVTYAEKVVDSALTVINRIRFVDVNVGYFAAQTAGGVRVYRTDSVGNAWEYQEPSIGALPSAERYNVVVPCGYNEVAAAGRKSVGGDGIIAIAR